MKRFLYNHLTEYNPETENTQSDRSKLDTFSQTFSGVF